MRNVFQHYDFGTKASDFDTYSAIRRIEARCVDMENETIVNACVSAAREAGINGLYLLDREFVLEAIREKIERTQREGWL